MLIGQVVERRSDLAADAVGDERGCTPVAPRERLAGAEHGDAVAGDSSLLVGERVRALPDLELDVRLPEPDDRETVDDDGVGRVGWLLLALLHEDFSAFSFKAGKGRGVGGWGGIREKKNGKGRE
jgi:hypothetical protein